MKPVFDKNDAVEVDEQVVFIMMFSELRAERKNPYRWRKWFALPVPLEFPPPKHSGTNCAAVLERQG